MKTVIRYQSQLLNRRSYKPGRRIRISFRPSPGVAVPLGKVRIRLPVVNPIRAPASN